MRNRNKSMTTRCIQQFAIVVRILRNEIHFATKVSIATSVAWMNSIRESKYMHINFVDRLIVCTRAKLKTILFKNAIAYYIDWDNFISLFYFVFFCDLCFESQSYSNLIVIFRYRQCELSISQTLAKMNSHRLLLNVQIALTLNNFAYQQNQNNQKS